MFYVYNGSCIILRDYINVFSAGEEWTENPETYESSFYKRTLDNEIYIFTAPSFNGKFAESFEYVCVCVHFSERECLQCWPGTEPILLSAFGRHPNPTGKDHTLRPLISLSLSFSFSRCVFQRSSPPSLPPTLYTSCYLH